MNDTAWSATSVEVCGVGCQLHLHTGEISPVDAGMNEDPHHWHGRARRQSAADEGCTRLAGIHPVHGYRDQSECAANSRNTTSRSMAPMTFCRFRRRLEEQSEPRKFRAPNTFRKEARQALDTH